MKTLDKSYEIILKLLDCSSEKSKLWYYKTDNKIQIHPYHGNCILHIISNEKIKTECLVLKENESLSVTSKCLDEKRNKLIATTLWWTGLPEIPKSFIRKYVDLYNKGKISLKTKIVFKDISSTESITDLLKVSHSKIKIKDNIIYIIPTLKP